MERAYWCGKYFEHFKEWEKASLEFQQVWICGQNSLRAEYAKKFLTDRKTLLEQPERFVSPIAVSCLREIMKLFGILCLFLIILFALNR